MKTCKSVSSTSTCIISYRDKANPSNDTRRQLLFSKRKRRATSGRTQTHDVLRSRQMLYQLSHRGSSLGGSAGQAESLKFIQGKRRLSPDKQGYSCTRTCTSWTHMYNLHVHTVCTSVATPTMVSVGYCVPSQGQDVAPHEVGHDVTRTVLHPLPAEGEAELGHCPAGQVVASFIRHDTLPGVGREGGRDGESFTTAHAYVHMSILHVQF